MGVFFFKAKQQAHGAQVWAEIEKVFGSDLADHDALRNAAAGKGFNHFCKLANFEPNDLINKTRKFGICFAFECDGDDAGDADGTGFAQLSVAPDSGLLCYVVLVQNIVLPAAAAHVHVGGPSVAGPVVIPIKAPGRAGVSAGCARDVNHDLLEAIAHNPGNYDVNVHNAPFPGGAVRGQLEA